MPPHVKTRAAAAPDDLIAHARYASMSSAAAMAALITLRKRCLRHAVTSATYCARFSSIFFMRLMRGVAPKMRDVADAADGVYATAEEDDEKMPR